MKTVIRKEIDIQVGKHFSKIIFPNGQTFNNCTILEKLKHGYFFTCDESIYSVVSIIGRDTIIE